MARNMKSQADLSVQVNKLWNASKGNMQRTQKITNAFIKMNSIMGKLNEKRGSVYQKYSVEERTGRAAKGIVAG